MTKTEKQPHLEEIREQSKQKFLQQGYADIVRLNTDDLKKKFWRKKVSAVNYLSPNAQEVSGLEMRSFFGANGEILGDGFEMPDGSRLIITGPQRMRDGWLLKTEEIE